MTKKIDLAGLEEVIVSNGPFADLRTSSQIMTRNEIIRMYIKMMASVNKDDSELLAKIKELDET